MQIFAQPNNKSEQPGKMEELKTGKQMKVLMILACFFLSFTFFVFGPLQLYLSNINELWFSISDLWLIIILCGAAAFGILFLIGWLLKGKAKNIYICILFGLALGFYLQGNVIGVDYGVLNGTPIDWESYAAVGIVNTLTWAASVAVPLIVYLTVRQKKLIIDIIKIGSVCIVLLEIVTLFSIFVTTDLKKDNLFYMSTENLNLVSDNGDTVIFILDTFDKDLLEEVLAENPDCLNAFEGFTCFTNATSVYPTTKFSLPYLLTNQYYENEQPLTDYIKEAWKNTDYYTDLKSAGYSINIYTGDYFLSKDSANGLVDNFEIGKVAVSSHLKLAEDMYRFTAFRYLPHYAKQHFWFYSGIFDELRSTTGKSSFSYSNASYIESLDAEGLTLSDYDEKIYKLIHLEGTHTPYTFTEDMRTNEDGVRGVETAKGCLNMMKEYIRQLKELNVYDSTTIIITADHGFFKDHPTSPILLAKPKGASGDIRVSNAPVSHSDLIPTVLKELGLNGNAANSESIFDIQDGSDRLRKYLYYNWDGDWDAKYAPDIYEYNVAPGGNDLQYFKETGNIYTPEGVKEASASYRIGDPMIFGSWMSYGKYSIQEQNNMATIEVKQIEGAKEKLLCKLSCTEVYGGGQNIIVRSVGKVLFDGKVTNDNLDIIFWMPPDCINNGKLVLNVECPDSDGNEDEYPLMFSSITLNNSERYEYHYGNEIVFTEASDGTKYFAYGISMIETDVVWSSGYSSKLLLDMEKPDVDLVCRMKFRSIYPGSQRMIIKSGGILLFDDTVSTNSISFNIPKECVADGTLSLDLEYPGAISPHEYENAGDTRILSFGFESIAIDRIDANQQ